MIQRKQTLYLLFVACVSAALFFLPLVKYEDDPIEYNYYITGMKCISAACGQIPKVSATDYLIISNNVAVFLVAMVSIFMFKNRRLQILLTKLNLLLICLLMVLILTIDKGSILGVTAPVVRSPLPWSYLPVLSVVCCILSVKAIKKDEELVRSADRIR